MGTRSRIGVVNPSGSITSIYCHWDGYPDHHLPILTGHYDTKDKVADLIALGSLSSLGRNLGTRHAPQNDPEVCTSHFRDHGDLEAVATLSSNFEDFLTLCDETSAMWYYLFRDDTWWEVGQP